MEITSLNRSLAIKRVKKEPCTLVTFNDENSSHFAPLHTFYPVPGVSLLSVVCCNNVIFNFEWGNIPGFTVHVYVALLIYTHMHHSRLSFFYNSTHFFGPSVRCDEVKKEVRNFKIPLLIFLHFFTRP